MDPVARRENSWVYYNGDYRQYKDARVGLLTHALNYGTGCFEGIRAYWNAPEGRLYAVRMPEHYARMAGNAKTLQIALPHTVDELCDITIEVLRRNSPREDMYIRPLAFKSDEIIGVKLHDVSDSFAIVVAPMGDYIPTKGIRCMVSSWRRVDDTMMPARAKITGIYVN